MNEINYLNLPAIYGAAANIQSAKINSRLDAMKMAEYEKELAKRENRNALAKNYFSGGSPEQNLQPQMTPAPAQSFTGNALAAPEYSAQPNVNIPATAPKQDYAGYANALMGSGDLEGGMSVMAQADAQKKHALDVTKATVDIANTMSQMDERQRAAGLKNLELIGNAAAGVLNEYEKLINSGMPDGMARQQVQPLYEQTKSSLVNAGIQIQNASPVFNPDEARSAVSLVLGVKDRINGAANQTKEQLYSRSIRGDKEATAILNKMQADELKVAKEKSTFKIDTAGAMTPEAIDMAATRFRMTGEVPKLGTGGAGIKTKILNRAAEQAKAEGQTAEAQAYNQMAYKASGTELAQIQKQRGLSMSFEKTANKNLDLALKFSDKVDRTGSPLINKYTLWTKGQFQGDPNTLAFFAAVKTATNEYAKVVTGQTGGAAVSDKAREETERILNSAYSKEAFRNIVENVMKPEMANRRQGYEEQINELKGTVTGEGTSSAPQARTASTPSVPKIGEVLHGYKFKGGDPSSPNSWEQVH